MIELHIATTREQHQDDLWVHSECYRFYAKQRQLHCTYLDIMDFWLLVPYCDACTASDPSSKYRQPEILPENWEVDVLWELGPDTLSKINSALNDNSQLAILCKRCTRSLRPWEGDSIHVIGYHLEEHYGIPLETPGKKDPSDKQKRQIINLYDRQCFNCHTQSALHIDHIRPQSKGGDSAFRNLQPLCRKCGNTKGDEVPTIVEIFLDIYFGLHPPDGYEGLFW